MVAASGSTAGFGAASRRHCFSKPRTSFRAVSALFTFAAARKSITTFTHTAARCRRPQQTQWSVMPDDRQSLTLTTAGEHQRKNVRGSQVPFTPHISRRGWDYDGNEWPSSEVAAQLLPDSREGKGSEALSSEPAYRATQTAQVVAECDMPTACGRFRVRAYRCQGKLAALEPVAVYRGHVTEKDNVLVRVHDQCLTSEVFGSQRCDCKEQLGKALRMVAQEGGVVIYLQQEGRGIGLANKIAAYALQDRGVDTVDANRHLGFGDDERTYDVVPSILDDLGIRSIRLLTNNPSKLGWIQLLGVHVTQVVPIVVEPNTYNRRYLLTKAERMAHFIPTVSQDLSFAVPQDAMSMTNAAMPLLSRRSPARTPLINPGLGRAVRKGVQVTKKVVRAQKEDGWQLGRMAVENALTSLREGQPIILVDVHKPEEGISHAVTATERCVHADLVLPASKASVSALRTFLKLTSGIIYAVLSPQAYQTFLRPTSSSSRAGHRQGSTQSGINASHSQEHAEDGRNMLQAGVDFEHLHSSAGSAAGRAATLQALSEVKAVPSDFKSPGHVFPVTLSKHAESSAEKRWDSALHLVTMAADGGAQVEDGERKMVVAVGEVVERETGEQMSLEALIGMAKEKDIVLTAVADVRRYCKQAAAPPF